MLASRDSRCLATLPVPVNFLCSDRSPDTLDDEPPVFDARAEETEEEIEADRSGMNSRFSLERSEEGERRLRELVGLFLSGGTIDMALRKRSIERSVVLHSSAVGLTSCQTRRA